MAGYIEEEQVSTEYGFNVRCGISRAMPRSRWIHRGEVQSADMCLGIVGHRVTETLGMI